MEFNCSFADIWRWLISFGRFFLELKLIFISFPGLLHIDVFVDCIDASRFDLWVLVGRRLTIYKVIQVCLVWRPNLLWTCVLKHYIRPCCLQSAHFLFWLVIGVNCACLWFMALCVSLVEVTLSLFVECLILRLWFSIRRYFRLYMPTYSRSGLLLCFIPRFLFLLELLIVTPTAPTAKWWIKTILITSLVVSWAIESEVV